MMVMIQKVCSFAWSCYDGTRTTAELSADQAAAAIRVWVSLETVELKSKTEQKTNEK
jgi:hypothetical protein